MSPSPSLAAPQSRPDFTATVSALDALLDWADVSETAPPPTFSSAPEALAAHVAHITRLAADSPSAATRERSALVAAAWAAHAERRGWQWVQGSGTLAIGVDVGSDLGAGADVNVGTGATVAAAIRRWVVVAADEEPRTVLLLRGPGQGALLWRPSIRVAQLPRRTLIGLAGLELIDLTELEDPDATEFVSDDVPAGARALADVVDGAVDLGLAIGFVGRVAHYLADRLLADGEAASEVEPVVLQQLGAAYAELGVVSEGLREAVLCAAGDPETWRRTAAGHRCDMAPQVAALLSDLFEAAGASATSGRYGLDRPWRDFTVRQALFPPACNLRAEEAR